MSFQELFDANSANTNEEILMSEEIDGTIVYDEVANDCKISLTENGKSVYTSMTSYEEEVDMEEIKISVPEPLKFTYSENEVLELGQDELLNIISIRTTDDITIFFDQILSVEPNEVIINGMDNIPISSYEKYEEITKLFARYKLFRIMHDPEGTLNVLQQASSKLENIILTRMNDLEAMINQNSQRMVNHFESEIGSVRDTVLGQIEPAVTQLNETSNSANVKLGSLLTDIQRKIDSINTTNLNTTITKLQKVSNLLGEVVE